jgi:hypothetical protein
MKRVKLPKDVWVSLYGKLHDILYNSMMHKDIDGKECTDDDVSHEVLKLMDLYFDRSFGKTDNADRLQRKLQDYL